MNSTIKLILVAIIGSCLVSGSANAGWLPGTGSWEDPNVWNNTLATPNLGTSYNFEITGTARTTWYWDGANGISFSDHSWSDISGSDRKYETMKFQFSQPVTSFTFTTPKMIDQLIEVYNSNSLVWDLSADNGGTWTTLWNYTATDNSVYRTFSPETVPTVTFSTPTNQIRLRYYETAPGFCGGVSFTGVDGGSMAVHHRRPHSGTGRGLPAGPGRPGGAGAAPPLTVTHQKTTRRL